MADKIPKPDAKELLLRDVEQLFSDAKREVYARLLMLEIAIKEKFMELLNNE